MTIMIRYASWLLDNKYEENVRNDCNVSRSRKQELEGIFMYNARRS